MPFIFFGFLDNFLMILFGDAIEMFLSTKFPISTMACAGLGIHRTFTVNDTFLGNLFSDACGIGAAGYIEKFSTKFLGMQTPDLSAQEQKTTRVNRSYYSKL